MPRISVIIPAYNAQPYLARALDSVLAQDFSDYEIVVMDDGSTDETAELAASYPQVRLVKLGKNRGQAAARNAGIAGAKGELLAFLDADDEWLPEKLERQLEFMRKKRSALSFTDTYYDRDGSRSRYSELAPPAEGKILVPLLRQSFITMNTVIVQTKLIREAGGFSEDPAYLGHEDFELWLRLAARGVRFDYLPEPLAVYYAGHESSSSDQVRMRKSYLRTLQEFLRVEPLPSPARAATEEVIDELRRSLGRTSLGRGEFRTARTYFEGLGRLSGRERLELWLARLLGWLH